MRDERTVADVSSRVAMMEMLRGFQVSQAVCVVAKLGIATAPWSGRGRCPGELVRRTGADFQALWRLVRTLAPMGVFATDGELVSITPLGTTLSEKHPGSLHGFALMWMETHYLALSQLDHGVRTGRPGADRSAKVSG